MKKHNFNAGPSILPQEVIEKAAQAVLDFNGSGLSILSISHRTKDFDEVMDTADKLFRELLDIPENYKILFLGGGASTQFFEVAANFLGKKAGYVNTGVWSKKAIKEAKRYGEVEVLATSEDKNFTYIPKGFAIPADLDYLHITTNNTIYGTEYHEDIDSPVPLIADMSSDILSGRREEVRHDLRRCPEEPGPRRRHLRHRPRRHAGEDRPRPAHDGELPHPRREQLHVQHPAGVPHLRAGRDPEVGEEDRRRAGALPPQRGEGRPPRRTAR